jgi:hypothetical protein
MKPQLRDSGAQLLPHVSPVRFHRVAVCPVACAVLPRPAWRLAGKKGYQ